MEFRDILAKFGRMGAVVKAQAVDVMREYAARIQGPGEMIPLRIPAPRVCAAYAATAHHWAGRRHSQGGGYI